MADSTERKTVRKTEAESLAEQLKQKVEFSGEKNVLNSYRSSTYNFTLAALRSSLVNKPDELRDTTLDLIILQSGGKGTSGLSSNVEGPQRKVEITSGNNAVSPTLNTDAKNLVNGFNESSPGRFDMFIDNVEITTYMTFSQESNLTLPTSIRFEVIEPYSINGFIEALHVAAKAAGYPSYLQASFVLKVEFIGYPDDKDLPLPEQVPNSVRYFPIAFTGVEVEITERGTRYNCTAVPYDQRSFGLSNVVKTDINGTGKTIKEILESLFKNIDQSVKKSDEVLTKVLKNSNIQLYKVKFPKWNPDTGYDDTDNENDISKSNFVDEQKTDSVQYSVGDPTEGQVSSLGRTVIMEPIPQVQFPANTNIDDAVISIVRDSMYVRGIVESLEKKEIQLKIDKGFLDYFSVRIEIKNLDIFDPRTQKPLQEYTYVISPYKIHYSRIPGLGTLIKNEADISKSALREYNYIYTGLNVDVINFKLQYNSLYFEAVPASLGNYDEVVTKNLSKKDDSGDLIVGKLDRPTLDSTGKEPVQSDPEFTNLKPYGSISAGNPLTEYAAMAKAIHQAITNSKASMIHGEIEILGDPFYLVTGGMGSYNPKPMKDKLGHVGKGEAPYSSGEVLIVINFTNAIDYGNLNEGGYIKLEKVPFSGAFRVNKAVSTFKNGDFRQRLEILRVPGQVSNSSVSSESPDDFFASRPRPKNEPTPSTDSANLPQARMTEGAALSELARGTPYTGLPGELSNYTAATGGLGGSTSPLLTQTPGFTANPLAAGSVAIGQPLPTNVASTIRLSTSGITKMSQSAMASAAIAAIAANVITKNIPSKRVPGLLAGVVAGLAIKPVLSRSTDISLGAIKNPASLVIGLSDKNVSAASDLGKQASNLVNGIGDKISSQLGSLADPGAIAAKVGIDASKISGLSAVLQSKVIGQIKNITKDIPPDVNLTQAAQSGLALDLIPFERLKNIPATAPKSTAPPPIVNQAYINQVAKTGGVKGLEDLYGVTNLANISSSQIPKDILSNALNSVPSVQKTALNILPSTTNLIDASIVRDKIATVGSQLSNLTNQIKVNDSNVSGSVSSLFGSITKQSPLAKLVDGLGNKNV